MNLNISVCLQVYKAVQSGDYNILCWCSFKKLEVYQTFSSVFIQIILGLKSNCISSFK